MTGVREKTLIIPIVATGVPQRVTADDSIWTPVLVFERNPAAAANVGVGDSSMAGLSTARYVLTSTWPSRRVVMGEADADNGQTFQLSTYWLVGTAADVVTVTYHERY